MRLAAAAALVLLVIAIVGDSRAATPPDTLIVAVSGDLVSIDPPFSSGAPFQNEISFSSGFSPCRTRHLRVDRCGKSVNKPGSV